MKITIGIYAGMLIGILIVYGYYSAIIGIFKFFGGFWCGSFIQYL